jgi:hypothetical protein
MRAGPSWQRATVPGENARVPKYARFATDTRTAHGGVLGGVLHAIGELRRSNAFDVTDSVWLTDIERWFERSLAVPTQFSARRGYREQRAAVCWFRDGAKEHLARATELAALLARHGVRVHRLESANPGTIVWQDEHQVVAIPHGMGRPSKSRRLRRKKP